MYADGEGMGLITAIVYGDVDNGVANMVMKVHVEVLVMIVLCGVVALSAGNTKHERTGLELMQFFS